MAKERTGGLPRGLEHHNGTTLESAQRALAMAKQQVADLERLVQFLEQKQEDERNYCGLVQQQHHHEAPNDDEDENNDSYHIMKAPQGQTLLLIMEWLGPQDLLSCIQVCRYWCKEIDQICVWRQAVMNLSPSRLLIFDMENTLHSKEKEETKPIITITPSSSNLSFYKTMAIGFVSQPRPLPPPLPEPGISLVQTTLQPKDILLVVEMKDKCSQKVIGCWHRSLQDIVVMDFRYDLHVMKPSSDDDDKGKIFLPSTLEDRGDYSYYYYFNERQDPTTHVPEDIYQSLEINFRYIRCDTGQSHWLGYRQGFRDMFIFPSPNEWVVFTTTDCSDLIISNETDAGRRAKHLFQLRGYDYIDTKLFFKIRPHFANPSNGDDDNNDDDNNNNNNNNNNIEPTTNSWRKARYYVKNIDFGIYPRCGDFPRRVEFRNIQEYMLGLEGMHWQ